MFLKFEEYSHHHPVDGAVAAAFPTSSPMPNNLQIRCLVMPWRCCPTTLQFFRVMTLPEKYPQIPPQKLLSIIRRQRVSKLNQIQEALYNNTKNIINTTHRRFLQKRWKKVMSKQSTKYFNHYYYHHGPAIYIQSTYYPPKSSLSAIEAYSTYIMLSQGENPYIPTTTSLLQNLSNGNIFWKLP